VKARISPDRQRLLQRLALAVGVVVVLVQGVHLLVRPRGDFQLHWELGRRLAAGEFIYEGGHDSPYLPFWGLAHAPLSVLPVQVAQLCLFPLVLVALFVLLRVLRRLTNRDLPLSPDQEFWMTALALLLSSRFLVRDMFECGVNLALVALSWLAVLCWVHRREWLGGTVLGLATALKCTPALFLAWFVWKRQWKMSGIALAATAAFTLSPALWMGPAEYARSMQFWYTQSLMGATSTDPTIGPLGEEPLQNIALRPALGRFLTHLPADHMARLDHPLYVDLLDLPSEQAGFVARMLILALVAAAAWFGRHRITRRDSAGVYWECAGVSLLILLLSPITWGQHCVGVLPAFYLIARTWWTGRPLPRVTSTVIAGYSLLILVLNRAVIGKELTYLLDSYRITTWCLLALVVVAMAQRAGLAQRVRNADDADSADHESSATGTIPAPSARAA
jgi:hypothetical protein